MAKIRTLVVEDQNLWIDLIRKLLDDRFELIAACQGIEPGWEAFEKMNPDMVILDIELPDGSGLELAKKILKQNSWVKILGLSGKTDDYTMYQVFMTGFYGFVDKNTDSVDDLKNAINQLADGNCYYSSTVQKSMMKQRTNPSAFSKVLTEREQELLCFLGVGASNEAVAERTGLRPVSVQNYRARIMKKLGLHSTVDLIRYAFEKGFVNQWEFRRNTFPD